MCAGSRAADRGGGGGRGGGRGRGRGGRGGSLPRGSSQHKKRQPSVENKGKNQKKQKGEKNLDRDTLEEKTPAQVWAMNENELLGLAQAATRAST